MHSEVERYVAEVHWADDGRDKSNGAWQTWERRQRHGEVESSAGTSAPRNLARLPGSVTRERSRSNRDPRQVTVAMSLRT